ncbi:MAG: carboxypeptidase regulatory-like domain-containing protein [Blastocatellia bacterium]
MQRKILVSFFVLALAALMSVAAFGQVTSSLSGTVTDPNGAVVANAQITVKNVATGATFTAVTSGQGAYTVASLGVGKYTVDVTANGFKSVSVKDVEINAGIPATVNATLEIGQASESVVVQGGGEVIQTQSANISTTLNTSQIINLPLVSRNPVNFVALMAGVNTPRDNRNSTINGLPEAAIDITLDGINVQDNFNKTGDGLFVRVAPTLDSIEEVTVSTATPEAAGGAMGAVQVKFITRQGGNEFHGSLYEYHRNTALNSAYWFTNRDASPYNVKAAKICGNPNSPTFNANTMVAYTPEDCQAPRAANLFNQFGGRLGGPIWLPKIFNGKNKAFFFVNYEEFRQPTQVVRQRTILNPLAQSGVFRYGTGANVRSVNLLELATRSGHTATVDPTIGKLLSDIRTATGGNGITDLTDPNQQRFTYNPSGQGLTKRPTVRFDVNVTDKHKVELSWTYQLGRGGPDFLNGVEPAFPGFPNQGNQPADRYTGSLAVRSTLAPTLVNEARTGLSGGPSRFNPAASAADYSQSVANMNGFALNLNGALGVTNPYVVTAPSRRNPLFRDFSDTLTWSRGVHNLTFGGKVVDTQLTYNAQTLVPIINFGVDTNDPANTMFTTANFTGASATDLNNARALYAVLTGRVTAINANARLVESTGKFEYLGNAFERSHQKEFGLFVQDSWRIRQNLTVNAGIRWEVQRPFTVDNSSYTTSTLDDIWGVSGPGNMFKPGTQTGRDTRFIQMERGTPAYKTDYKNFAPNFGFAWRITGKGGWLNKLAGDGQTVIRGGYSIAYNRQGIGDFRGLQSANPGVVITTNRSIALGNLGTLPLLFRENGRLGAPAFPASPAYPLVGDPFVQNTNSVNVYDPNIKVPYSQSWTFGIQRELDRNTVLEARYVGTRNLRGWTTYNLNSNELNIAENGLLQEFRLAQTNLQSNIAAGRGNNFRYFGPGTGTSPLPITLAYFSGTPAAQAGVAGNYTSTNFASTNFLNSLAAMNPVVCCATATSFAGQLENNATFRANALRAGLPANFMLTNPGLRGGANFTGNGGYTRYDALQIDLRRRLSNGLQMQANYQFAKSFGSARVSFRAPRVNELDTNTLRHAVKVSWTYELPFGRGKALFGGIGRKLDLALGGWEFHGSGRVQSGQLYDFGNVNLVGMTGKDLAKAFKLRFDDAAKIAYLLPQDIIDNTIRAFNASATSANGYGTLGAPTGRYIAPANGPNCLQVYSGQCAPQNVFVTGPKFTRFDLSVKKQIKLTERYNFELRAEFLNAFNNINFFNPTAAAFTGPANLTFMQVTTAYTDASNTNDPGGRLVQLVARFNF